MGVEAKTTRVKHTEAAGVGQGQLIIERLNLGVATLNFWTLRRGRPPVKAIVKLWELP